MIVISEDGVVGMSVSCLAFDWCRLGFGYVNSVFGMHIS